MEKNNSAAHIYPRLTQEDLLHLRLSIRQRKIELRQKFLSLFDGSIPKFRERIAPYLNETEMDIDWRKLFRDNEWTCDETLGLQWLRSLWEEKMHVRSKEYSGLLPDNWELRQSVFLALAESHHLSYMIDEYHRKKRPGSIELSA